MELWSLFLDRAGLLAQSVWKCCFLSPFFFWAFWKLLLFPHVRVCEFVAHSHLLPFRSASNLWLLRRPVITQSASRAAPSHGQVPSCSTLGSWCMDWCAFPKVHNLELQTQTAALSPYQMAVWVSLLGCGFSSSGVVTYNVLHQKLITSE